MEATYTTYFELFDYFLAWDKKGEYWFIGKSLKQMGSYTRVLEMTTND